MVQLVIPVLRVPLVQSALVAQPEILAKKVRTD